MRNALLSLLVVSVGSLALAADEEPVRPFVVTDASQTKAYDERGRAVTVSKDHRLWGQDAHYESVPMRFRDNGDGTVLDLQTGLEWQRAPAQERMGWDDALIHAAELDFAGHQDWRLPAIKELTSIANFDGSIRTRTPYLDTEYFAFQFGDESGGRRDIDSQYWSSTKCLSRTMFGDESAYGFNFADAHIKAYPVGAGGPPGGRPEGPPGGREGPGGRRGPPPFGRPPPPEGRGPGGPGGGPGGPGPGGMGRFVLCVRGNPQYGLNDFVAHDDGTVTDRATGLVWQKGDSGKPMDWPSALAHAEGLRLAGKGDWRLPDAKELMSIVDYSRSPAAKDASKRGPAIDPVFDLTDDDAWFWTSTSHGDHLASAIYICFGQGWSAWKGRDGTKVDAHGAGALRSDPKTGDPSRFAERGRGPQGDEVRILNYVRCVRGP